MRYRRRTDAERCQAVVILRDGSEADCQRYRREGSRFCTQHTRMYATAAMTSREAALLDWFNDTWRARTAAVEAGKASVDWVNPDFRIIWEEIRLKAHELSVERASDPLALLQWWNEVRPNVS